MFIITLDTDWVPQFIMDYVLSLLGSYGIKSTLFLTGNYELPNNDLIEASLHPHFLAALEEGKSFEDVIVELKSLIPTAIGNRSHQLFWHNKLTNVFLNNGILYDSSVFLPFHPGLKPIKVNKLVKMPYWWGDGFHIRNGFYLDRFDVPGKDKPGLKILNFHPINIYLNMNSIDEYVKMKQAITDLQAVDIDDLRYFRCKGFGMESFFLSVLEHIGHYQRKSFFLKELLDAV